MFSNIGFGEVCLMYSSVQGTHDVLHTSKRVHSPWRPEDTNLTRSKISRTVCFQNVQHPNLHPNSSNSLVMYVIEFTSKRRVLEIIWCTLCVFWWQIGKTWKFWNFSSYPDRNLMSLHWAMVSLHKAQGWSQVYIAPNNNCPCKPFFALPRFLLSLPLPSHESSSISCPSFCQHPFPTNVNTNEQWP